MNETHICSNVLDQTFEIELNQEYRQAVNRDVRAHPLQGEIVLAPGPAILEQRITNYGISWTFLVRDDTRIPLSSLEFQKLDFRFLNVGSYSQDTQGEKDEEIRQLKQEITRLQSTIRVEQERRQLAEDNLRTVSQAVADRSNELEKVREIATKATHENSHLKSRIATQATSIRAFRDRVSAADQDRALFRREAENYQREALLRTQELKKRPEFPEELLPFFEVFTQFYEDQWDGEEEERFADALGNTLDFMEIGYFLQSEEFWTRHFKIHQDLQEQVRQFQARDTVRIENPKKINRLKSLMKKAMHRTRQMRYDWHCADAARKAWNYDYGVILGRHLRMCKDLADPILLDPHFRNRVRNSSEIQMDILQEEGNSEGEHSALILFGWMDGEFEHYQLCRDGKVLVKIIT